MKKYFSIFVLTFILASLFPPNLVAQNTENLFLAPLKKKVNCFSVSFLIPAKINITTDWFGGMSKAESYDDNTIIELTKSCSYMEGKKYFNMKGNHFIMSVLSNHTTLSVYGDMSEKGDMLKECTVEYHDTTDKRIHMKIVAKNIPLENKYMPGYFAVTPGMHDKDYFTTVEWKVVEVNELNRVTKEFRFKGEVKQQGFKLNFE